MLSKQGAVTTVSRMERLALIKERHRKLFSDSGSELEDAFIADFDDDEADDDVEDIVLTDDDLSYESN